MYSNVTDTITPVGVVEVKVEIDGDEYALGWFALAQLDEVLEAVAAWGLFDAGTGESFGRSEITGEFEAFDGRTVFMLRAESPEPEATAEATGAP